MMVPASSMALLPSSFASEAKTHLGKSEVPIVSTHSVNLRNRSVPASAWNRSTTSGIQRYLVVAQASREDSDSSSGSIFKFVKDTWNESEDRVALVGLGIAGIVGFWASVNLVGAIDKLPVIPSVLEFIGLIYWHKGISNLLKKAIDKLPVIPSVLEFIGLIYSWYFIYRYLLFKPDREKLVQKVKKSLSDVIGK